MKIAAQIEKLDRAVEALARSVNALDEPLFLADLGRLEAIARSATASKQGGAGPKSSAEGGGSSGRWSPRDIVAHLVGWNRHVIEGSRQILRGELPFYDLDPGEDYSKVNAALVREIATADRSRLLAELRASARELSRFLQALDPDEWRRDHGVRHAGSVVTVETTVDELIEDYFHHRRQIED